MSPLNSISPVNFSAVTIAVTNPRVHPLFPSSSASSLLVTRLRFRSQVSSSLRRRRNQIPLRASENSEVVEEEEELVEILRVPESWLSSSNALKESEWLRASLKKWLDDEYCPEEANLEISKVAAQSYYESLTGKIDDVGEILMNMVKSLQSVSFQESFHGAFSSANAAVHLITLRMESYSSELGNNGRGGEKAEILPPKLESSIFLDQRVAVAREHAEKKTGLCGCIASERGRPEPRLTKLISPIRKLHLPCSRRTTNC